MIPVDGFAVHTARIAAIATKLQELDQMWALVDAQSSDVASKVCQQHEAGLPAGNRLYQLEQLNGALAFWERDAVETMVAALSMLREVGNG